MKTITFEDFNCPDAIEANKLVDYYEDKQERYVKKLLDDKRADWNERGFNVQTRNIVKSIIDKSGLLFNRAPKLAVYPDGASKGIVDANFMRIMDRADWLEFFQNVDVYTRLLKTTVVLQQKYIPSERTTVGGSYKFDAQAGDALMLRMLHRGTCVVRTDVTGNTVTELAYFTSPYSQLEPWTYRYISADAIEDWRVEGGEETLEQSVPNPDGLVPATPFYDVRKPRNSFWFNVPEDLLSFQDNVNLFQCDLQYAMAHQMQKSLFLDTEIVATDDSTSRLMAAPMGHTAAGDEQWNMVAGTSKKTIGGLGSIVYLEKGMTGQSPMVKFDGPDTDLKPLYEILSSQIKDIAADWDVQITSDSEARANSGFLVVAEHSDNLALREKRSQSFQAGLRRFYDVTQVLYPELHEGTLMAEFAAPTLPINRIEEEQVWQYRIQSGAYTILDRLLADGFSEDEALAKIKRDNELRKLIAPALPAPVPAQDNAPTDPAQRGGNPKAP
jgi:hypothetical protein